MATTPEAAIAALDGAAAAQGIPTYTELKIALQAMLAKHDARDGASDLWPKEAAAARDLLARIPN